MNPGAYLKEFLVLLSRAVPPAAGHAHVLALTPGDPERPVSVCSAHQERQPDCPACHTILPLHLRPAADLVDLTVFLALNRDGALVTMPVIVEDADWDKAPGELVTEVLRAWQVHQTALVAAANAQH